MDPRIAATQLKRDKVFQFPGAFELRLRIKIPANLFVRC